MGMILGPEVWLLVPAAAAVGMVGMLLTMAAAIRHSVKIIDLEERVKMLHARQRELLIRRGLIEPDPVGIMEVDVADDEMIEAVPVGEPAEPDRQAA